MLNPYGASGNLIGIVFNYRTIDYTEVVFSPTGVVKLNRFENGTPHTVATANFSTQRNVAFEVSIENGPDHFAVIVNGKRFFENVIIFDINPEQFPAGQVGLITHWSPGRFDNVEFHHDFFVPCSESFDHESFPSSIISGTWDVNGGTLNSTAVGVSDIFEEFCSAGNSVYSARLRNEFGASGNLVGLIFNYQQGSFFAGDYNEVTFSPTGVVQLNKFIQGVRYPIASGAYNVPRNTWFNVRVVRNATRTSIRVNGTPVIQGAVQAQLRGGNVGAITHWTKGHFDDLSVTELVVRPPSEL